MKKHGGSILAIAIIFSLLSIEGIHTIYASTPQEQVQENPNKNEIPNLTQTPQINSPPSLLSLLAKVLGFIAFFSIFIYGSVKIAKNYLYANGMKSGSPNIQIVSSRVIGPRKSLCMVEVLDHILLLGVTEGKISVLLDMPWENLNEDLKKSWQLGKRVSEPKVTKLINNWFKK